MKHEPEYLTRSATNRLSNMQNTRAANLKTVLTLLAAILIVKVTCSVVLGYRNYFPPNFQSDFLRGRQVYFFGAYRWAFYAHLIAGPASLILGLILVSEKFRRRFSRWHRSLGKTQAAIVLLFLLPSGLWMAHYAQTGTIAAIGFSLLAVTTGTCVLLGWVAVVKRRFAEHRLWMLRCFVLLCSAVVLRVIGGLITVTGIGDVWGYPIASWASWLVPLVLFELAIGIRDRRRSHVMEKNRRLKYLAVVSSLRDMEISKS